MRPTLLIALFVLTSVVFGQTTRLVPSQFATIQSAIVASSTGDTVLVAPGTYLENIEFLGKGIALRSTDGPAVTSILGVGPMRVVWITETPPGTALAGFTITGAYGGLRIGDGSAHVSNCVFTGNTVLQDAGAGIRVTCNTGPLNSEVTIEDCVISNNVMSGQGVNNSPGGGGLAVQFISGLGLMTFNLRRCVVESNVVNGLSSANGGGGGLAISGGGNATGINAAISDCRFHANSATHRGGGVYVSGSGLTTIRFDRCTISSNMLLPAANPSTFDGGAGLWITSGPSFMPILNECVISGNSSAPGAIDGGGMRVLLATIKITNCTFADNFAVTGGALRIQTSTGLPTVKNSVFWGNGPMPFSFSGIGGPAAFENCNIEGAFPTNSTACISSAPMFVDPANGDYRLTAASPCIDAGNSLVAGLSSLDLESQQRIIGPSVDIGADEFFGLVTHAAGNVGIGSGGPYDLLTIDGSAGLPSRVVDVALDTPFMVSVAQPVTNPFPANFALLGFVGVPGLNQTSIAQNGIGTLCIPTGYITPGYFGTFVITNNFAPEPAQLVASSPAPWSLVDPGLPFPIQFTLQAAIHETPGVVRLTNALILNFE